MSRLLVALILSACSGSKPDTTPQETGGDSDSSPPEDSEPQGTDDDGDGWTVEDGDCDDTSIYVNPAWDEDPDDGIDNDCDGRIDEVWAGFTVLNADSSAGGGSLLSVDTVGRKADELAISGACILFGLAEGLDAGWVSNDSYAYVATVDEDGTCTDIADFSETDFGLYSVATSPGAYYVASTGDAIYAVTADGTTAELASWSADYTDPEVFERFAYIVVVDRRDGTVGIFDYFGGFATWSETDGLVEHLAGELEGTFSLAAGAVRDGGGWVALGYDGSTGAYGVYDFDLEAGAWTLRTTWEDTDFSPSGITVEGDTQDVYATAHGGWYSQVVRVRYETGEQGVLYETPEDDIDPDLAFSGIVTVYE